MDLYFLFFIFLFLTRGSLFLLFSFSPQSADDKDGPAKLLAKLSKHVTAESLQDLRLHLTSNPISWLVAFKNVKTIMTTTTTAVAVVVAVATKAYSLPLYSNYTFDVCLTIDCNNRQGATLNY